MPNTVNAGWLKDKNGDKFAPKTLTSQVQTNDGTLIEDKIKADIDATKEELAPLVGTTAEITPAQVAEAVASGRPVAITHTEAPFGSIQYCYFNVSEAMGVTLSTGVVDYDGEKMIIGLYGSIVTGEWILNVGSVMAEKDDIPDAVVNPTSASVGQAIVVDEVDVNGKPTKWKAVDYQERTHGSEWIELLPETTLTFTNSQYQGVHDVLIEPGKTYKVLWNGTEYILTASYFNLGTMAGNGIGNQAALGGTDTGEPFMLGTDVDGTALLCVELTGAASATVSIMVDEVTTIPLKYLPDGIGYEIIESVLPATSTTYVEDGADKYFYINSAPELIIGQNYLVDLNGTVYNCTAKVLGDIQLIALGNLSLLGFEDADNSKEPFVLYVDAVVTTHIYVEDPIPSSLTVSITHVGIHCIPTKYLPDGIGYDNSEVILPLTDLRYVDESIDKYFVADTFSNSLVADESYTVTYNGAVYTCIAKVPEGDYQAAGACLGNFAILGVGPETTEPFLIMMGSDNKLFLYTNDAYGDDGITTATLSIVRNELRKIPEKYLPEIDTKIDAKIDNIGIPAITVADAGKFLRVSSDGKWVAESISNAEEVAY